MNVTFYGLDFVWYDMLRASPYVTTDPEKADYFYFPVFPYWSNNVDVQEIVAAIKKAGPWWERKEGADHIFTVPHDFGRCDWGKWWEMGKVILIHHFGKVYEGSIDNPCDPLKKWSDSCDPWFVEAQKLQAEGISGHRPCHIMRHDIVVPPTPWEHPERTRFVNPDLRHARKDLIFFAGPVNIHHGQDHNYDEPWSDNLYSFGARQSFARMFRNYPGVRMFEQHISNYADQLSKVKFCIAAAGWGWGGRMKAAVTHGCIPLIIQDGIKVEWEDELPMFDFAIRLPGMYLHRLPEILHKYVRTGHAARLQKNLKCVWRLYWWTRPHGRAFEMTMCTLKSRLLGVKLQLDLNTCTLRCGDDKVVDFSKMHSV